MKTNSLSVVLVFLLLSSNLIMSLKTPFKHVILLCLENHSYDNMLGFMEAPIGDLDGTEV